MTNRSHGRSRSIKANYGLVALAVVGLLALVLYFWLGWNFYWIWFVAINVATFVYFRYDKRQSRREGATRVPEIVLQGLILAGGVLGGLGGMLLPPRHKTRKIAFWIVLAVATALHLWIIFRFVLA